MTPISCEDQILTQGRACRECSRKDCPAAGYPTGEARRLARLLAVLADPAGEVER